MNGNFRLRHLFALLHSYEQQNGPIDLHISHYFRQHKALGSKDRAFVVETLYAMMRWKSLLDYLLGAESEWEQRYDCFRTIDLQKLQQDTDIPPHIRVSFPLELFEAIVSCYGLEHALEICLASNSPAPTTVRTNALKISREELLKLWQDRYDVIPCENSPHGITFRKKINFFELPEFKQGLFEVQDENSQQLAMLVGVTPGDLVLDFCAGSGGKSLAFAPQMHNKGQIFLHDIRMRALIECRKRLKRAGIQNAQIIPAGDSKLKKLKKRCDWILVDAPCTGTGTLRRNPDMKWKIDNATIFRLVGLQRSIFEQALSFLKPSGKIVYATCSLLAQENQLQLEHFETTYNLKCMAPPFQSLPAPGGGDGFFGVILQRA